MWPRQTRARTNDKLPWLTGAGHCNPWPQISFGNYIMGTADRRAAVLDEYDHYDLLAEFLLLDRMGWDCMVPVADDYGNSEINALMAMYCTVNTEYDHNVDRLYAHAGGDYQWLLSDAFDHECLDTKTTVDAVSVDQESGYSYLESDPAVLQVRVDAVFNLHVMCAECQRLAHAISTIALPNVRNNVATRLWFKSASARAVLPMPRLRPDDFETFEELTTDERQRIWTVLEERWSHQWDDLPENTTPLEMLQHIAKN